MTNEEVGAIDDSGISAWDAHDAEAFMDLFADEFVWHDWTLPDPITDRFAGLEYFSSWITAFPDMSVNRVDRVIGDDAVAGELEYKGTNTGPMLMGENELPPTNKSVVGRGTYFAKVSDGKIVEFRSHPDVAGLMMQLGLMPPM